MPACTLVGLEPSLQPCARTPATVRTPPATACTQPATVCMHAACNRAHPACNRMHAGRLHRPRAQPRGAHRCPRARGLHRGWRRMAHPGGGPSPHNPQSPHDPSSPHGPSSPHSSSLVRPLRSAQPPRLQRLRPAHCMREGGPACCAGGRRALDGLGHLRRRLLRVRRALVARHPRATRRLRLLRRHRHRPPRPLRPRPQRPPRGGPERDTPQRRHRLPEAVSVDPFKLQAMQHQIRQ